MFGIVIQGSFWLLVPEHSFHSRVPWDGRVNFNISCTQMQAIKRGSGCRLLIPAISSFRIDVLREGMPLITYYFGELRC